MSYIGTDNSHDAAAIFPAFEKMVYNLRTNDENPCTTFCLPLHESRALITIT